MIKLRFSVLHRLNNSILWIAALSIFFMVFGRLALHNFEPSYFILAGAENINKDQLPDSSIYLFDHQGYDGQYFYRYAINPWSIRQDEYGIHVDSPNYRKQRIVYPLLVWALSFGQVEAIPLLMILVNMAALFWIVFIGRKLLRTFNLPDFYALFPLLFSGLLFALSRNLSEVVESAFLITALYFGVQRKMGLYALFATITVLTKETSLLLFAPLSFLILWEGTRKTTHFKSWLNDLIFSGYPLFFFLVWKFFVKKSLLSPTFFNGGENFSSTPFQGLYQGWLKTTDLSGWVGWPEAIIWHLSVIWIFFLGFCVLKELTQSPYQSKTIWLGFSSLFWLVVSLFFTHKIWEDDWSFMRVFASFSLISIFFLFFRRAKLPKAFLLLTCLLFCLNLVRIWVNQ